MSKHDKLVISGYYGYYHWILYWVLSLDTIGYYGYYYWILYWILSLDTVGSSYALHFECAKQIPVKY